MADHLLVSPVPVSYPHVIHNFTTFTTQFLTGGKWLKDATTEPYASTVDEYAPPASIFICCYLKDSSWNCCRWKEVKEYAAGSKCNVYAAAGSV